MQKWSAKGSWFAIALFATWTWTTPAAAAISIFLRSPSFDDLKFGDFTFGNSLPLMVVVQSTSAVDSVSGRLGPLEFELLGSPGVGYEATVSTVSLARGKHSLVITAINADGEQAIYTNEFMLDRAPAVSVTSPVAGAATDGHIAIDASCADDGPDGCSSLMVVYRHGAPTGVEPDFANLVACGTDRISGTYDLSRFAGTNGSLNFLAHGATGPGGLVASIPVAVTGSPSGAGVVVVSAPVGGEIAQPEIDIATSCGPDCAGMYVFYQRAGDSPIYSPLSFDYRDIVACGPTPLAQTIDLSRYEGSKGWLIFASMHDPQRSQASFVPIAVESSPHLCEEERVTGLILDADAGRVLLLSPELNSLEIYDRVTHQYRTIQSAEPLDWWLTPFVWAKLTPFGAAFQNYLELWELNGDALIRLSSRIDPSGRSLQVAGDFLMWREESGLYFRNLATRATYLVAETARSPQLAANGDVVFTNDDYQVLRYRQGATSQLTFDETIKRDPVTDGTLVAYEEELDNGRLLALLSDGRKTIVGTPDPPHAGQWGHALSSGWLAYTRPDEPGVFLREPNGTSHQLTDVPSLQIEAVSNRGEVTVSRTTSVDRVGWTILERRLLTLDSAFVDATSGGTPLFIDGHGHMAVAGSLFRIAPTGDCTPDGGTGQSDPDGGLADAGLADADIVGGGADASESGAEDAASDAPEDPALDAGYATIERDAAPEDHDAGAEDAAGEPEELDAGAPPDENDAEMNQPDAGRRRKRRDFACSASAPGAPTHPSGRPALASLGLLLALASWARRRRPPFGRA